MQQRSVARCKLDLVCSDRSHITLIFVIVFFTLVEGQRLCETKDQISVLLDSQ